MMDEDDSDDDGDDGMLCIVVLLLNTFSVTRQTLKLACTHVDTYLQTKKGMQR